MRYSLTPMLTLNSNQNLRSGRQYFSCPPRLHLPPGRLSDSVFPSRLSGPVSHVLSRSHGSLKPGESYHIATAGGPTAEKQPPVSYLAQPCAQMTCFTCHGSQLHATETRVEGRNLTGRWLKTGASDRDRVFS